MGVKLVTKLGSPVVSKPGFGNNQLSNKNLTKINVSEFVDIRHHKNMINRGSMATTSKHLGTVLDCLLNSLKCALTNTREFVKLGFS